MATPTEYVQSILSSLAALQDKTEQIEIPASPLARQLAYASWEGGESVPWIDWIYARLDEMSEGYRRYQVQWEPAERAGWRLERHTIPKRCYERIHHVTDGPNPRLDRDPGWGDITALKHNGKVWMSDTRAEVAEHAEFINALWWSEPDRPRVLINGLGLGMAVKAALTHGARHVDVVELDPDVIEIIAPNFEGQPVTIHQADAREMTWPRGTSWDLAWHDIWPTIDADNLPEMELLHRKYGKRVRWQASWQRAGCKDLREHDRALKAALEAGDWELVRRLDPEF